MTRVPAIDPQIATVIDASDDPFLHTPASAYRTPGALAVLRKVAPVPQRSDVEITDHHTADGLRLRVYRPRDAAADLPLVYFVHGGGWVSGSPEFEEARALAYAADVPAVVVSVDYRLAPENPFPTPADDVWAGLGWTVAHAAELGADPTRLAVAGASAGGNLAAATVLRARDDGAPRIAFQLLVYPALDDRLETASARELTGTPVLDRAAMTQFWTWYGPDGADDGYAAPARADSVADLPPTLVVVAEVDPLRDDGIDYARRLPSAGVSTGLVQVPGAVHGFDVMFPDAAVTRQALADQARALRNAL